MKHETEIYTLPAYWASYLINGDAEKAQADIFLRRHNLESPVSCSDESWFARSNDSGVGLSGLVLEYTFLREVLDGGAK